MPMDRRLYPENWEAIALAVKTAANWQCQECGRPCRQPGESVADLIERLAGSTWNSDLWDTIEDEEFEFGCAEVPRPQRFTLTVAHLDHQPWNCDRANLRALCSVCHCRYDLSQMPRKKALKRERLGQLNLFSMEV